ncbi:MAG: hypothetical protein M3N13_00860 [Candidatus Eremiobacteraeota bacterium]|nr:hypothetical protein [Candidatus Eremiobacteraeota bacterium]
MLYAQKLLTMVNHPAAGAPSDAQAMARLEVNNLRATIGVALSHGSLDTITRAHLQNLRQRLSEKPAA